MQHAAEGGRGEMRLDVARAVLAEYIRPADPAMVSSLRVFGSGAVGEACRDTELAVPFDSANQGNIISGLNALAVGDAAESPLAAAIVAAMRDLSARPGPHWLVVITGGPDTCNPDAHALIAQEASRSGI